MPTIYTSQEIKEQCEAALRGADSFYNASCVKDSGKTSDNDRYYTEVVAEYLLENFDELNRHIGDPTRQGPYDQNHQGDFNLDSSQKEGNRAKLLTRLRNEYDDSIGTIIDYQIPLKNDNEDKKGKIDLLSVNARQRKAYILEYKYKTSDDPLLKNVLEAYTHARQFDLDKAKRDFEDKYHEIIECENVVAACLIHEKSKQATEYREVEHGQRPVLKELMEKMDVKVMMIDFDIV